MPKRISTTLLFTVVVAIFALFIHSDASGKVCIMYLGGDCVFWSGSVEGELTASELGDIINEPKSLGFTIYPRGPGLLYCKNPEITEPKKIPLEAEIVSNIGKFGDSVTIKRRDVDQCCGIALVSVVAELNDTQLGDLDKHCKDPGWEAINFVPSEFDTEVHMTEKEVHMTEKESKKEPVTAKFKCVLPDWETLGWEKNKPEQRPYICDRIQPR
ncbi:MAG: hypothetical protein PVH85_22130 [Desulfobacterales bacterium]|jgi:hypothetical protein